MKETNKVSANTEKLNMNLQLLAEDEGQGTAQNIEEGAAGQQPSYTQEDIERLVEERAKEIASKNIVKEKNKLKKEYDLLSQQKAELESERLAKMNQEEKTAYQIEELSKKLAEMQKATQEKEQAFEYEKMTSQTKDMLVERGLPIGLSNMVMAGSNNDAETIMKNIQSLEEMMKDAIDKKVEERIKASSHIPKSVKYGDSLSLEDISKMTPEQINARWDDIMKQGRLK